MSRGRTRPSKTIPITDPATIALPLDPFEVMSQRWNLSKLDVFEEKWKVPDTDYISYIKTHMGTVFHPGPSAGERYWKSNEDEAYRNFALCRQMSPILSARSRQQTPTLGAGWHQEKLPRSNQQLLLRCDIKKAGEVTVKDQPVNTDDILTNKLLIDAETHRLVLVLIQSVPMLVKAAPVSESPHVAEFLRGESPPPDVPDLEMLPIFPYGERFGEPLRSVPGGPNKTGPPTVLETLSQLPDRILAPVVKDDEDDLAEEHLVVVDGWKAFRSSSPSIPGTPSLADSSSDVDELFLPSSPGSPFLAADQAYIEEYQIPRSKKIGGSMDDTALPREGGKLSDFLPALVRPSQGRRPRIVQSPRPLSSPPSSSPRTIITISMLGQPPTVPDASGNQVVGSDNNGERSSDDSITFAVKAIERVCGDCVGRGDPATLALQEKLDEGDGMLMDVPLMRPPNEHAKSDSAPTRLADLLAPVRSGHQGGMTGERGSLQSGTFVGCLKKVKGLQSLQIELSWIPFKYGKTVPTDEEAADVRNDPCPQLAKDIELAQDEIVSQLTALLDESKVFGSQPAIPEATASMNAWLSDDKEPPSEPMPTTFEECQVMILTRDDRRRLAGLPAKSGWSGSQYEDSDDEQVGLNGENGEMKVEPMQDDSPGDCGRPTKRVRFSDIVLGESPTPSSPIKPEVHEPDDSGVFMIEDDDTPIAERSTFCQLACDAEGFEGPNVDSHPFPDLQLNHPDNYSFDVTPEWLHQTLPLDSHALSNSAGSPSPSDCYLPAYYVRGERVIEAAPARPRQDQPAARDRRHVLPLLPALVGANRVAPAAVCPTVIPPHPETFGFAAPGHVSAGNCDVRATALEPWPSTMSARQPLAHFLSLCGKGSLSASCDGPPTSLAPTQTENSLGLEAQGIASPAHRPHEMPQELIDSRTLLLPAQWAPPNSVHRYMASMELLQRRGLVRALSSVCCVDLVEREYLGPTDKAAHLILDCETAVLFTTVELLPTRGDILAASLTQLSWRFSRLLVVFECYPSSWSHRSGPQPSGADIASAWSPPVVKAVNKLRREIGIAEGIQTKRVNSIVEYAFASTVEEAAIFSRAYGDAAAARDGISGEVWGTREWLAYEERDGEYDLSGVDGMNNFAASLLLSQISLEDFLEKSADDRLLDYGDLVGMERITQFNVDMARRMEAMQLPPSSPISGDASSSSNTVPYFRDSELDDIC
ncbi:hypothetical protein C8Q79DRAFT_937519 [Trametes meyenii]|nr:hypothetical protein C8Q79DRAFT_937519 [Trametes meyenii]